MGLMDSLKKDFGDATANFKKSMADISTDLKQSMDELDRSLEDVKRQSIQELNNPNMMGQGFIQQPMMNQNFGQQPMMNSGMMPQGGMPMDPMQQQQLMMQQQQMMQMAQTTAASQIKWYVIGGIAFVLVDLIAFLIIWNI